MSGLPTTKAMLRAMAVALAVGAVPPLPALATPQPAAERGTADGGIVVPFEPSPAVVVDAMLRLAEVTPADTVIDLGSGDGRIVVAAARDFGARAIGVELDPRLVRLARERAARAGVADRATFFEQDIFRADLSSATVVTMFLYRHVNLQLRPRLLDLAPGTRLVSHYHDMGEWRPDRSRLVKSEAHYEESWVRMWIVPAKVAGIWEWRAERAGRVQRHVLTLRQSFQEVGGVLETESLRPIEIRDGRLTGGRLEFWIPIRDDGRTRRWDFRGTVDGATIAGEAAVQAPGGRRAQPWSATRAAR